MPKIARERPAGDDGHTIARCERALASATALAQSQGEVSSVLQRYWEKQLSFARERREWRWGEDEDD